MKEKLPASRFLLSLFFLFTSLSIAAQSLRVEGKRIVNDKGEEVILRGMGLGGWMLQEPYMLQLADVAGNQQQIKAKIESLVGAEKTQQFYNAYLENYLRKIDVDSMAKWGFNSIRLPMHYNLYTLPIEEEPVAGQNTWLDKGFQMTDEVLEWCKANNIYLILDLHAAPGGQGHDAAISDYNNTKPSLWESEANKQKTVALWKKLAERYANEAWIGGYDLINEPNWGFENPGDLNGCNEKGNEPLKNLYIDITRAIREVDSDHMIFIEGNCWANNHSNLLPFWDNNMVLSFHKYWTFNDTGSIEGFLALRDKYNVPLWMGESGENSNSWHNGAIELFEKNHIGWAWWTLKKIGLNTPLEIKMVPGFKRIIDYWKGGAKPSETEAFAGLMELAEAFKLENALYHKDYVDAMFRQVRTNATIPFKPFTVTAQSTLFAADYDLGKNLFAYSDKDTSNYHISTGTYTAWNNGWSYRNDGVDIEANSDTISNGFNVGWTNDGEWLQYTVNVPQEGYYDLKLRTATSGNASTVSISSKGLPVSEKIRVRNSGGFQNWIDTEVKDVFLSAGTNALRVNIDTGGFNFNYIRFGAPKSKSGTGPKLLLARTSFDGKTIEFIFNQPLSKVNNSSKFEIKVNETFVKYNSLSINQDMPQVLSVKLKDPIAYGDFVYASYSGNSLIMASGDKAAAFSNVRVEVNVFNPLLNNNIPGKIEAENFEESQGIRFEVTSDAGGGRNLAFMDSADYFTYEVMVKEAGIYTIDYRHAGESQVGKVNVYLVENRTKTFLDSIAFLPTGGWQTWNTVTGAQFELPKGEQILNFEVVAGNFNFNWFKVNLISVSDDSRLEFLNGETDIQGTKIFLDFTKTINASSISRQGFKLLINGNYATIDSIAYEGPKTLTLFTTSPILPNTIIKVAYDGKGSIRSTDGDKLKAFGYQLIANNMDPSEVPINLPGRVEAEAFKINSGFQTEGSNDEGGGQNVGYTDAGDYLDYLARVTDAGTYKVDFRVAGYANPGKITLQLVDEGTVINLTSITFPSTNGWQNWQTFSGEVNLPAGRHRLRFLAETGAFNFNWMHFSFLGNNNLRLANPVKTPSSSRIILYPNPSNGSFSINHKAFGQNPGRIIVSDELGKVIFRITPDSNSGLTDVTGLTKGAYLITVEGKDKSLVQRLIVR